MSIGLDVAGYPVVFEYDEGSSTWRYHVDEPQIVGGGFPTMDDAMAAVKEAIAFVNDDAALLEASPNWGREVQEYDSMEPPPDA